MHLNVVNHIYQLIIVRASFLWVWFKLGSPPSCFKHFFLNQLNSDKESNSMLEKQLEALVQFRMGSYRKKCYMSCVASADMMQNKT